MTHDELIQLITAHKNREPLQFRNKSGPWRDVLNGETLDDMLRCMAMAGQEYRVKPKPRELWVNEYPSGGYVVYRSKQLAEEHAGPNATAVHYREVIE